CDSPNHILYYGNRAVNIVLVSQEYPPARHGGIGSQCHQKAIGFARRGHEVTVIAHATKDLPAETHSDGVRVLRVSHSPARLPIHTEEARWLAHSLCVAEALHELESQSEI